MANISDAHGSLSLLGEWNQEQIKALAYVLNSQDSGADYTTIFNTSIKEMISTLFAKDNLYFVASGRWAFHVNLEALHNWSILNEEWWDKLMKTTKEDERISYSDYMNMRTWLFKEMHEHDLQIHWEFLDFEPGICFLDGCQGWHYGTYDTDKNEYVLKYNGDVTDSFDYNLKNYCEIFLEDTESDLYDIIHLILNLYKLDKKFTQPIHDMIQSHATWYDFMPWQATDKKTDLPLVFRKKLLELIRNGGI